MFYDEKMEAIRKDEERIARNMLADGDSVERVSRNTGLVITVVQQLADQSENVAVTA